MKSYTWVVFCSFDRDYTTDGAESKRRPVLWWSRERGAGRVQGMSKGGGYEMKVQALVSNPTHVTSLGNNDVVIKKKALFLLQAISRRLFFLLTQPSPLQVFTY